MPVLPYMSPAATPDPSASPIPPQQTAASASASDPSHLINARAGTERMDDPQIQVQIRTELERTLLKLSQDLYEMEICAGDVVAGQEDRVPRYLRQIDRGLVQLSELAGKMGDTVPRQIVDFIDRHRNPHAYTRATLNRATGENQYALGRTLGLESFRRQLESGLGEEFPDLPLPERRHQPHTQPGPDNKGEDLSSSGELGVKQEDLQPSKQAAA